MRAVADTNTLVSAFLWGGFPLQVLKAARAGRLSLFTSAPLLAELDDVLSRRKFAQRIAGANLSVPAFLAGYRALALVVHAGELPRVCRDPDDDQVLACAMAAGARLIISRDADLLLLNPFDAIQILPAREALAYIGELGYGPVQ